jgi:phage baseplate assembly protein W|tara:strand:- start:81 stop:446 length:366 start_codon:yes stop_codon:yes gene_type:complete
MIKEIYSRDIDAPKYNDDVIEVTDELQQLILKIENCLFTRQGDVLGSPDMGCNLDDLVFSLVLNESVISQRISSQIQTYCLQNSSSRFGIDVRVQFYSLVDRSGCLVDIYVNEQRVIGALF